MRNDTAPLVIKSGSCFAGAAAAGSRLGLVALSWLAFAGAVLAGDAIPIRFHTDQPGFVSLNVFRPDGGVARQLLTAAWLQAGDHQVVWDGTEMSSGPNPGRPLPAGEYSWRAIFHQGLGLKLRGWACNGGSKPWESADGRGDWGGDSGVPSAVAADGERVYLGWSFDTTGRAVVACDSDGKPIWSEQRTLATGCKAVAVDDGIVYVLGGGEGDDAQGGAIHRLRASDGAPVPWPNDVLDLKITSLWPADGKPKPSRADAMAVRSGHIYLSFTGAQFMTILDAKTGAYLETIVGAPPGPVDATPTKTYVPNKPGEKVDGDFAITILNGHVLGKLLFCHDPLWIVGSDMTALAGNEQVTSLTIEGDNAKFRKHDVFVGLGEPFHQVQARPILRPEGFTWIAGRAGGRGLLGPWQSDGLRNISAVALDGNGKLWAAEADGFPKRFSAWTTEGANGKLACELFGAAGNGGRGAAIFPGDPNVMVGQGCEWRIDPKTGRAACLGVITREGMDCARFGFGPKGRAYLVVRHSRNGPVSIFERVGDGDYKMRARIFQADAKMQEVSPSTLEESATQTVLWADENGDGERQSAELHAVPGSWVFREAELSVTEDLTLCGKNPKRQRRGFRWKVDRWTECGAPIYNFARPTALPAAGEASSDGRWVLQHGGDDEPSELVCWDTASSRAHWTYPVGQNGGVNPAKVQPDESAIAAIPALSQICGRVNLPAPLGNVWFVATGTGSWHLLTEDGFYLSQLFESDPAKIRWPANAAPGADMTRASAPASEVDGAFGGSVTRGADGKVYVEAGKTAYWNLELTGLETVKSLGEGKVKRRGR